MLSKTDKIAARRLRKLRVRVKVKGSTSRPRVSVFRSSKYIYAQLIDDQNHKTLASLSSKAIPKKSLSGDEKELFQSLKITDKHTQLLASYLLGKQLAELAHKKKIKTVVFDRAGYKYHGRVKLLAEGLRAGGLEF